VTMTTMTVLTNMGARIHDDDSGKTVLQVIYTGLKYGNVYSRSVELKIRLPAPDHPVTDERVLAAVRAKMRPIFDQLQEMEPDKAYGQLKGLAGKEYRLERADLERVMPARMVQAHVEADIDEGMDAMITSGESGELGVLFLEEDEFIPFADLGYNRTLGYFRRSQFPDQPNEAAG
jgi:hypothetical protein